MQNIQYILDDIEQAIECKAYLPALALALTLPDMCGKVAGYTNTDSYKNLQRELELLKCKERNDEEKKRFSELKKMISGYDYKEWLRATIYNEEYSQYLLSNDWNSKDIAEIIYNLRCAFLHTGETVENATLTDDDGVKVNYNFELIIEGVDKFGGSELTMESKVVERNHDIRLAIVGLCKELCNGARVYFNENRNNPAWNDKTIKIVYHEKVESKFGGFYKTTNYQDGAK